MRNLLFASLALALAACGDPLFFAEVEEKKICFELPSVSVQGTGSLPDVIQQQIGSKTVSTPDGEALDFGSQVPALDKQKATTGSIKLISFEVTSSTDALQHIEAAELDVADANGQLVPFMHYERPAQSECVAGQATCTITMTIPDGDLLRPILANAGHLPYKLSLTGTPPQDDWTVKVDTCMSAKIMVDALKL